MELGVRGLGFGDWDFNDQGSGFRVRGVPGTQGRTRCGVLAQGLWSRVWGLGHGVCGLGFDVCGLVLRVDDLKCSVQGSGFKISGLGFRVYG